ncbi:MAG TPA: hypothetical protein VH374_20975 [Polyangia bacterium]|jgi:hypothetical protein|nr:hypothetical protein [Polyangia bacterium]
MGRRPWRWVFRARLALVAAGFLAAASSARAADVATKLTASGVSPAARERFDESLRRALAGGRYTVVSADKASYELSAEVVQTASETIFKLRLTDPRTARVLSDRDGRCTGCDDAETASRLQLAAESLLVTALETPAGQAGPGFESGRAASADSSSSGWTRALPWVGLLGIAGASAAVHAHYKCRDSAGQADACTLPLIGLTSLAVLSAGLAVGTSLSLSLGDSSRDRAGPPRWAPWVILLSGVAAGASGVGMLTENGYDKGGIKALGYVSIGAGAVVAATALGAIIKAPDGSATVALAVAPTSVGVSACF